MRQHLNLAEDVRRLLRVDTGKSFGPELILPARRKATIERSERILSVINTRRKVSPAAYNLIQLSAESERFDERKASALPQFQDAIGLRAPDGGTRFRIPRRRFKTEGIFKQNS